MHCRAQGDSLALALMIQELWLASKALQGNESASFLRVVVKKRFLVEIQEQ
jgi:uncharacterized membrane protein